MADFCRYEGTAMEKELRDIEQRFAQVVQSTKQVGDGESGGRKHSIQQDTNGDSVVVVDTDQGIYDVELLCDGMQVSGLINVANSETGRFFYDITKIKVAPAISEKYVAILAHSPFTSQATTDNHRVSQKQRGVNTQYTQNARKNSIPTLADPADTAETHIDELAQASTRGKPPLTPDRKNHPFARDGFDYRTAFFMDNDGQYYRITMSVGVNGEINTVYNVGKLKEAKHPDVAQRPARVTTTEDELVLASDNHRVSQKQRGVNTQYTPNARKIPSQPWQILPIRRKHRSRIPYPRSRKRWINSPTSSCVRRCGAVIRKEISVISRI